jgi:hypothetical protein
VDVQPARPRKVLITNGVIFKVFIINNLAEQTFSWPVQSFGVPAGTHVLRMRPRASAASRMRRVPFSCQRADADLTARSIISRGVKSREQA